MNRREFLALLGIGTTTVVAFGTGVWLPDSNVEIHPRLHHWDMVVMDDMHSTEGYRTIDEFEDRRLYVLGRGTLNTFELR